MRLVAIPFQLGRHVVLVYALLSLAFSLGLVLLSLRRGPVELAYWLSAYVSLGVLSLRLPRAGPLVAGLMAFLLGFVRTHQHGYNLDLGLGLIALSVGIYSLSRARRGAPGMCIDIGGLSLLSIAVWSLISMVFAVARIRSFVPAPGFSYHVYRFNLLGLSSEEAVVRAILGAAGVFVWFGLYQYARSVDTNRRVLNGAVFLVLLVNATALLVQRHLAPGFLRPAGLPVPDPLLDRLNGVTSFCWALGDIVVALYLLLPAWGSPHGFQGVFTAASFALLIQAVVASGSRTALLATVLASVLWAGIRLLRLAKTKRRLAVILSSTAVAMLLGAGGVAYRLTPPNLTTPLGRLKEGVERQGLFGHLYATRLSAHPLIFRVLRAYPLSGVGVGLYGAEVDRQRVLLTPNLIVLDFFMLSSNAPNQFLNTGVELGVPAMLALVVVFVHAGGAAWSRWRGGGSGDLAVSLLTLALALQFGPGLQNSEALVFNWLIVGLAAGRCPDGPAPEPALAGDQPISARKTSALVAAAAVLGIAGQLLALPSLAVDRQWKLLRWRMNIGLKDEEPGGRWTSSEATFVVDTSAPAVVVRWHAGDPAVPGYRAEVCFYVDGALVERTLALSGRIRESVLQLPLVPGLKRISVRVSPPFVPFEALGRGDRRELGIFIHAVSPSPGAGREVPPT